MNLLTPAQTSSEPWVAILIPCYNEAASIARVIDGFRSALPHATVYVYDNNSSDRTGEIARVSGAVVRRESLQGKGNVVRRMFADIDADVYILVDGDGTYDAQASPALVERLLMDDLDMVTCVRVPGSSEAYRLGHQFGNRMLTALVAWIFGNRCGDMLSGYRAFSRRFVKSFPALAKGFEIETELTVHALELRMPIADVPTPYGSRDAGSTSKLHTIRDGLRIGATIVNLVRSERPLPFFALIALLFAAASLGLGYPIVARFMETGLVPRLPTAVLAMGLMIVACLSLMAGLVLDAITVGRRELRRLHYLATPLFRRHSND